MGIYSKNLDLYLPVTNEEGWGEKVNENFVILDSEVASVKQKTETELEILKEKVESDLSGLDLSNIAVSDDIDLNNKSIKNLHSIVPAQYQWVPTMGDFDNYKRADFSSTFAVPSHIATESGLTVKIYLRTRGYVYQAHAQTGYTTATISRNRGGTVMTLGTAQVSTSNTLYSTEQTFFKHFDCQGGDIFSIAFGGNGQDRAYSAEIFAMQQVPVSQR